MLGSLLAQKAVCNPVLPAALGGCQSPDYQTGSTNVGALIGAIIGWLIVICFLWAFFYIITGALSWITSGGDKGKLENARNRIVNAIIGLIIAFAIWAIMSLIGPFFGIDFPEIPFPTIESVTQPYNDAGEAHRDPLNPGKW